MEAEGFFGELALESVGLAQVGPVDVWGDASEGHRGRFRVLMSRRCLTQSGALRSCRAAALGFLFGVDCRGLSGLGVVVVVMGEGVRVNAAAPPLDMDHGGGSN